MLEFALPFVDGLLVKLTDAQVDEKILSLFSRMQYATAIAYGAVSGYLLSTSAEFSTVFLAVAIGVLLGKKIDRPAHQYAFATLFATIAVFGVKAPNLPLLALFVIMGAADEYASDFAESRKGLNKAVAWFFSRRFLLDLAALGVSLATGNYAYFFAIFSFDIGYQLVSWFASKNLPPLEVRGHQLLIDLYDASPSKLDDLDYVYKFLDALPPKISMTKIMPPYVFRFSPKAREKNRERGVSGVVLIAESHISIHTYPEKHLAKVDVYSCKDFDAGQVAQIVAKAFSAHRVETQLVKRGIEHLSDLDAARKVLVGERKSFSRK
ncbi:MAG: adenosylmethionine decarboxylase [Candidatus Micrarchaeia archaeon]|jgi:S-adenosylmethionine decarboxylase